MATAKKKSAAKKTRGKAVAKATTAKRTAGRRKTSASKKKGKAGLGTRAKALVPQKVKQTAMKALAGAAAGAVRAIIPPLQEVVGSKEKAASPSKSGGGRPSAR